MIKKKKNLNPENRKSSNLSVAKNRLSKQHSWFWWIIFSKFCD